MRGQGPQDHPEHPSVVPSRSCQPCSYYTPVEGSESMRMTTFADLLAERVRATPDDLMFEETEGRSVTFAEYASAVEALGQQIGPEAVVAWQLATSIDAAV